MTAFTPIWNGLAPTAQHIIELQRALTGAISSVWRLPNNVWGLARNAANTADVPLVRLNASDRPEIGNNAEIAANDPTFRLKTNTAGSVATPRHRSFVFIAYDDRVAGRIDLLDQLYDTYASPMVFSTTASGSGTLIEGMRLSGTDLYIVGNCSALSFTDRTEGVPEGTDALAELLLVRNDENGKIDHATLPQFARVRRQDAVGITGDGLATTRKQGGEQAVGMLVASERGGSHPDYVEVDERDLGNMISLLTVGMQQQQAIIREQAEAIAALAARIEALENKAPAVG